MLTILSLSAVIILAPLAVGSVYIATYSAIELIIFTLLFGRLLRKPASTNRNLGTLVLLIPFLFFCLFVLFQMLPMPASLIQSLSPNTYALYEKLGLLSQSPVSGPPFPEPGSSSPSLPLTLSPYLTSVAFLKWCAYGAVFLLITIYDPPEGTVLDGNRWLIVLLGALFFVGVAEAAYSLYLYASDPFALLWFTRKYEGYRNRASGTFINPNHLAGLMNIAIPASIGWFAAFAGSSRRETQSFKDAIVNLAKSRKAPLFYLFLFGITLMIVALIFSASRMGQFAFCAGLVTIVFLFLLRPRARRRRSVASPFLKILTVVLTLALLWGLWNGLDPVIERWEVADRELSQGRGILWETTLPLIRDFPLAGTGLGTYGLAYPRYQPRELGATLYDHAHNDYLEILSETGWVGFIPWLSFFLLFLISTIFRWFKRHDPFAVAIGAGGIAATVAILVHSFADFNLQIPANALLLFIIMAITHRVVTANPEPGRMRMGIVRA